MQDSIIKKIIIALVFLTGISAVAQAANLKKPSISTPVRGQHYTVLNSPGKTRAPAGKIEVIEFFWYGCPHCYRLEPYMEHWEANKADYIYFRRVPATHNRLWNLHARTYYTAEKLKVLSKTHIAFFDALHKERKTLTSQQAISNFFTNYGITGSRFNDVFSSFSVEAKLRQASKEISHYRISGVPSVVINGKYMTSVSMAGSEANLIEVIRYLSQQEKENPNADSS